MKSHRCGPRSGFTMIEVVMSLLVLSLSILFIVRNIGVISGRQVSNEKKQRAEFLCREIQETVKYALSGRSVRAAAKPEDFEDYDAINSHLPEYNGTMIEGHRKFKNYVIRSGIWSSYFEQTDYRRQINFFTVPNTPNLLRMRVRIYDYKTPELLAETITLVHRGPKYNDPVQVYRLYDVGVWKELSDQGNYPYPTSKQGLLQIQPILSAGLGRDPWYKPLNLAHNALTLDSAYNNAASVDSVYINNQKPIVSVSNDDRVDQFNHAARVPDEEREIPNQREKPTLRYLLNRMWSKDPDFQNVILLNSGPLLRVPAMRNYSDAAKNPAVLPYARAVTHPEKIAVEGGQEIRLRVYTYSMKPDALSASVPLSTVTLVLDQPIPAGSIQIEKMVGSESLPYAWATVPADVGIVTYATYTVLSLYRSPLQHRQHTVSGSGLAPGARLYGLEYIPCLVTAPPNPLPAAYAFPAGDHDLSDGAHAGEAKNTARWLIRLAPGSVGDGLLKVETRIGDNLNSGTKGKTIWTGVWPTGTMVIIPDIEPDNISRTYAWVGTPVPLTEQFQFLGDARHMPYADVKARHGYNWYFTQVGGGGYSGFDKTTAGWTYAHNYPQTTTSNIQRVNFDVPRYLYVIRQALLNSHSVFVAGDASLAQNENAVPLSYLLLGGEIMFEWTKTGAKPLRIKTKPWVPGSSFVPSATSPGVLEISNGAGRTDVIEANMRIVAKTDNSWVAMPWLGELYPDDFYPTWISGGVAGGNLPSGPGKFYRAPYAVFSSTFGLPGGTNFSNQIAGAGLATLVNGNPSGIGDEFAFGPFSAEQTATFTSGWKDLERVFVFFLGRNDDQTTARFRLDETDLGVMAPGHMDSEYRDARTRTTVVRNYMIPSAPGNYPQAIGIVRLEDPADSARVGHIVVNGNINHDWGYELGKMQNAVLGVSAFWESASPLVAVSGRVQPVPRVRFSSPMEDQIVTAGSLPVSWSVDWVRWDGERYSDNFPVGFLHAGPVVFNLIYSDYKRDWSGNALWKDALTHGPAGTTRSTANGASSGMSWNVTSLPAGRYLLRIEAYGQFGEHKAYQDCTLEIQK